MQKSTAHHRSTKWHLVLFERGFQKVSIDITTITSHTSSGNVKVNEVIIVFKRFFKEVKNPDEKSVMVYRFLMGYRIYVFGSMKVLQLDGGSYFLGSAM